ncbi:hypothetical protein ACLOJK_034245 [Asimina triloba]
MALIGRWLMMGLLVRWVPSFCRCSRSSARCRIHGRDGFDALLDRRFAAHLEGRMGSADARLKGGWSSPSDERLSSIAGSSRCCWPLRSVLSWVGTLDQMGFALRPD